ncbi:hypothetical protein PHSY_005342 [Pseudozyma hubeiensis SY62]|uniref:High-temperature-induced dauer-formation protein n=1 Tax=Pseudozyma hubeiensis (strain SY62) TaxID=1305764 RepID=R9PI33_PSEHS|nr:hypothetical protein PHSY_005342 [Pseudozyma hubeiensis SY62]GAC97755.1 hypothetical protein PHSY_005342 [Pseudozyma hubeiensis SY62]
MLSLPKRLFFGDQPKIDFKLSQLDGIARLYSERHIPYHDSKYWSRFLQFDTPTDIFFLLSLADLRRARRDAPENVVTLVRVMVAHLESLLVDPLFEPPPPRGANGASQDGLSARLNGIADVSKWKVPGASLMGLEKSATGEVQRDRTKEALNVIRILTRTLPSVLESEDDAFEQQVLWSQSPDAYGDAEASKSPAGRAAKRSEGNDAAASTEHKLDTSAQFVIDDEDDDEDASSGTKKDIDHPLSTPEASNSKTDPLEDDDEPIPIALGERLVRLVVDLLFCSGFTLPWTEDQLDEASSTTSPRRINYSIWEAGVGSSVDLPFTTRSHVSNRVEVLRLLLVLLSKSIYIPASHQHTQSNPTLAFAIQDLDRTIVLPLLCSLINTGITNARNSTAAWFTLPSVTNLVGGSNDEVRKDVVTLSLQILDVLLTYDAPSPRDVESVSLSTIGRPLPGPGGQNVFRFYSSKLHRSVDFDFIWTGLSTFFFDRHINSPTQILAIPISGARRVEERSWQLNQVAERMILLERLLGSNRKFRRYVLDDAGRSVELLEVLMYFAIRCKDNLALGGLVRLCSFMLQDVTSEETFARNLAKPGSGAKFNLHNRLGMVAGTTAMDYLVQGVYILIATTKGALSTLYAPLVIALSNTAPFWRNIGITSSTKLVHLLRSFSQPGWLLAEEGNPRLLFYVLETINSVLTVGFRENVNLVYSLVLARGLVEGLERFSFRKGVEDVWVKRRSVGVDTRDWFKGKEKMEKVPPTEGEEEEEKGKGKERRVSTELSSELSRYSLPDVEEAAAKYIGKNDFRPRQEWVDSWKPGLPLTTPRMVIDLILPEIERIAAGQTPTSTGSVEITGGDTDARVLAWLREQQMKEYLPPPEGGIHARGWVWTDQGLVWLRSYLWGVVYVEGLLPWGLWSDTEVRLFRVVGEGGRREVGAGGAAGGAGGVGAVDGEAERRTSGAGSEGRMSTPTS